MRALLDTNIRIDFLRGVPEARHEIDRYEDWAISVITWMEVTAGTRDFLDGFVLVDLNDKIAEPAVALRRGYRLKLPDPIIWASAQVNAMLLVTRDTKGFPPNNPGVRMPYQV